jgi:hypothetical protein
MVSFIKKKRTLVWILPATVGAVVAILLYCSNFHYAGKAGRILEFAGSSGGLIVHVNCGDGKLTAALRANDRYLVQGVSRSGPAVKKARDHIRRKGLYGKVSVVPWSGGSLP